MAAEDRGCCTPPRGMRIAKTNADADGPRRRAERRPARPSESDLQSATGRRLAPSLCDLVIHIYKSPTDRACSMFVSKTKRERRHFVFDDDDDDDEECVLCMWRPTWK